VGGLCRGLIFPALTIVPAWLGLVGIRAGAGERWMIMLSLGAALGAQLALERALPYRRDWRLRARRRMRADLAFFVLATLTGIVLDVGALALVYELAARLAAWLGGTLWPESWPIGAQLVLAIVIADFGHYWAHRALHDVPALWRYHELHHRPDHLHALNFFRMHPVEIALKTLANVTPLILLGAPHTVLALWTIISGVSAGSVNHANVAMPTRWLDGWFSTPALHRVHHSRSPEERGNLGNITMIYDRLFGTHRRPGRDVEAVGA
jgi:sterol desaturase/sphingolipid hydroxylase (fatty acid hydroxylase superfamily)